MGTEVPPRPHPVYLFICTHGLSGLVSLVGISLSSESHSSKLTKPKDGHFGGSDLQLFVQEHR